MGDAKTFFFFEETSLEHRPFLDLYSVSEGVAGDETDYKQCFEGIQKSTDLDNLLSFFLVSILRGITQVASL